MMTEGGKILEVEVEVVDGSIVGVVVLLGSDSVVSLPEHRCGPAERRCCRHTSAHDRDLSPLRPPSYYGSELLHSSDCL